MSDDALIGNLPSFLFSILYQRGIKTQKQIQEFLNPHIYSLADPFSICDMEKACKILEQAIYSKKGIFLYADGDVDGIAGASMFVSLFKKMKISFDIKLTHRLEDYEIEPDFIDKLRALGYELLITIDTGTTSTELIEYCEQLNFPLIIIDHHKGKMSKNLKCVAIINPSLGRKDSDFDVLTASGLAFKMVQAFKGFSPFFPDEIFLPSIELATIGTLSDYGLLTGENRKIVKIGLNELENTSIPGIEIFREFFYMPGKNSDVESITHYLNPKLNTPGRFGRPELTLKVLTATREEEIQTVFEEIEFFEKEKQKILRRFLGTIEKLKNPEGPPFLIFENMPVSFSGTFAARISEKFQLPALVAIRHGNTLQGSARGYDRIDLYDFFKNFEDIFISFGGHRNAVGFKMKIDFLNELKHAWRQLKLHDISSNQAVKPLEVNFEILTISTFEVIQQLKPFGPGNPPVLFTSYPVECLKITRCMNNKTIAWVEQGNRMFEAHFSKGFRMPKGSISITYVPHLRKSEGLYIPWLDIKSYSETF
ncbi:MAG TPA: DHH family phosphoesterase [bacterium]|nr:DHH family phosphoesterase [bacterium]HOL34243.1 DHH family phosphoesterase [bacterium]HPP07702.1 DHH family phosphoesterase [bacterium]